MSKGMPTQIPGIRSGGGCGEDHRCSAWLASVQPEAWNLTEKKKKKKVLLERRYPREKEAEAATGRGRNIPLNLTSLQKGSIWTLDSVIRLCYLGFCRYGLVPISLVLNTVLF